MEFNATFLIAAISFIVFAFIMNQILYKPMAKIVQMREKYISDNENAANEANKNANALIDDKNEKTKIANQEAGQIIAQGANNAKEQRNQLVNDAQINFKNRVEENKNTLREEKNNIKNSMGNNTHELAHSIMSKIMGREI
mgnify:CR=1 FL=1